MLPNANDPDRLMRLMRPWPRTAAEPGFGEGVAEIADFGSNPGHLRMLAYLPEDLPPSAPLVVVLHGCTQAAVSYARASGWAELAERHGFALLLPEQMRANNPNLCFDWFQPGDSTRGAGEVASIRSMIEHMLVTYGLDRRRVFVTGLSAGAAMAGAMLATYPELFAAGAIIAGLPFGCAASVQEGLDAMHQGRRRPAREWGEKVRRASPHRGPWPRVSIWHGTADRIVIPSNARETLKQWLDVHGLPASPSVQDRVEGCDHLVWRDRDGRDCVELYMVPGMGHGTPIAPDAADPDQRCGFAAPFILVAGVSSGFCLARSWGLLRDPARIARRRPAAVPPGGDPAPSSPHPRKDPNPAAVIDRALRAAGLLQNR